jgi:N6-adenosine-specific RNA methylase IME4
VTFAELSPPYGTIVADPPWQYRKAVQKRRTNGRRYAEDHYSTMTMDAIAAMPVADIADENAHLYLWVTNPRLVGDRTDHSVTPFDILKAWGFDYKTTLTWIKPFATGSYFRGTTEHVLFGVRGSLPIEPSLRQANHFEASRRDHSTKPEVFYHRVEQVSPGPYVELFCRSPRLGWDSWGYGYELAGAS